MLTLTRRASLFLAFTLPNRHQDHHAIICDHHETIECHHDWRPFTSDQHWWCSNRSSSSSSSSTGAENRTSEVLHLQGERWAAAVVTMTMTMMTTM
jgi:hypothetical protein